MADTTLCTFAELEFLLRSATGSAAGELDGVRRLLGLRPEAATDIVTAAGVASLLARGLCTDEGGDVVPGPLVLAAVAALSTLHTTTEAAGSAGDKTLAMHVFSGTAGRFAAYPGPFGLFGVEALDPAEPLASPLARFVDRCMAGDGEAAVVIKSDDGGSLAIARAADGTWLLADGPSAVPVSRADVVAALVSRFAGAAVGA
jgi:hypothetical protein